MNRHTIETMKRDTYTVPRRRSGAWQWLMAIVMAVFAVGAATRASAANFDARPFDPATHITASTGCGALDNIIANGETVTVTFGMTNKTASATTALVAILGATPNILNPSGPQLVTGQAPGGLGNVAKDLQGTVSFTFTVTGTPGQQVTATLTLTDGATQHGTVAYTFTIGQVVDAVTSFSNASAIAWAGGATVGSANPYPSPITVSGITGTVKKVTVTINNVTHSFPEDLQLLLETPNGNLVLMRDAGGVSSAGIAGVTFTLDDNAASSVVAVPDEAAIVNGTTYKTQPNGTNGGAGQTDDNNFLAPAPQPPYVSGLTALNGKDANGTYKLYVNDDSLFGTGTIAGGWTINVTTTTTTDGNVCNTTPTIAVSNTTINEDTVGAVNVTVADGNGVTAPKDIQLTVVSSSNTAVVPTGNIVVGPATPTDGNRTLTITPVADSFTAAGTPVKIVVQAKDGDGLTKTAEFQLTVTSVNDAPTIAAIGSQTTAIGAAFTVNTTVTDKANETAAKDIQVFADSSDKVLIPDANIQIPASVDGSRAITITPVANKEGTSVITLTAVDGNGGTAVTSFVVVVGTVTGAPTVSNFSQGGVEIPNNTLTVNEDSGIAPVTFTVVDAQSTADKLKVTVTTDNPGLVVLTGTGTVPVAPTPPLADGKQTITLTLNPNQFTSTPAKVFVTVTDPDNNVSAAKVLTVNVTPLNDPPTIRIVDSANADVTAVTVAENTAALVNVLVDDVEAGTNVSITKEVTAGGSVLKAEKIGIVSIAPGRLLVTALPELNQSGTATIKLTVSDGTLTDFDTFTMTVTDVNSPPSFNIADGFTTITVAEDSAAFTKTGWATGILPGNGSGDESTQTVSFTVTADKPALFAVQPAVSPAGVLTFTPALNANGVATVTVVLTDNGVPAASSAAKQFTISITTANDLPSFTKGADININEDANNTVEFVQAGWATAISPGPADEASQTVAFVVTAANPLFFSQQPAIDKDGKLTFKTKPDVYGTAVVTVRLEDSAGGKSADQTFNVIIAPQPDAPTITGLLTSGYSTSKNTASSPITFTVNDPDLGSSELKDLAVEINFTLADGVTPNPAFAALLMPFNSANDVAKSGGSRAFILTPQATTTSASGFFTVTVRGRNHLNAADGSDFTSAAIPFNVQDVNNKPVIILAGETKLDANSVSTTVPSALKTVKDNVQATFTVDVTDKETASANIDVTATSDNLNIAPLVLVATDGNRKRTLIVTFSSDVAGTNKVKITVKATDTGSGALAAASSEAVYELTVEHVNRPATIEGLPSKTSTIEDVVLRLPVTIKDSDATAIANIASGNLTWSVVTNAVVGGPFNGQAISAASVIQSVELVGGGAFRELVITPKPDVHGANQILVNIKDEAGDTNSTSFSTVITVLATNDAPAVRFTTGSYVATGTNAQGNTITGTLTLNEDQAASVPLEFVLDDVETRTLKIGAVEGITNLVNGAQVVVSVTKNDAGVLGAPALDGGAAFIGSNRKINIPLVANKSDTANKTTIRLTVTDLGDTQKITGTPDVALPPITVTHDITVIVNPVNDAPTMTPIASLSTAEDTTTPSLSFTINDVEDAVTSLNPTATSSNEAVVPSKLLTAGDAAGTPGIRFGGQAGQRTVAVTPAKDASGTAEISIVLTDSQGASATNKFTVTVTAVNDAPSFVSLPATVSVKKNEDSPLINFTIADDGPAGVVVVSATSANQNIVPNANIFFGGSGANRAMIISPARNASGDVDITVKLSDGTLETTKVIKFTVIGSNDSPTISDIANVTVDQNSGSKQVAFQVSDTETTAFFLTITGKASDTNLISNVVVNQGGTNRVATLVLEKSRSGVATVTITAADPDGGVTTKTFQVTVNAVNQPPEISTIADVTVDEDKATAAIAFSVVDTDSASFTVAATSSNTSLIPNSGVVLAGSGTNWNVTITPAANQFGSANISVVAQDAEGLTSTKTFKVTVNSVNDEPTITTIAALTTKEGQAVAANFNVSDAETATANLTLAGSSSATSIVPNANIVFSGTGSIRTVTVTPAAGASGTAVITITVSDLNGGSKSTSFSVTVNAINRDDFNADGLSDIVLQHDNGNVALWYMNGKTQISGKTLENPASPGGSYRVVGNGDFNGDGKSDILFQQQDGGLGIWYMNGATYISGAVTDPERPGDAKWSAVATADINLDGKKDILFQHDDGSLAVWYMNGNKLIQGELLTPNNPGDARWNLVAAGDFNRDGKADLIFQHLTDRTLAVWYMDGSKFVDSELLNPFDPTPGWVVAAAADYNGDGQADLVLQHDIGSLQVWFMKGPNGVDRQFLNPVNPGDGWTVLAPR